MSAPDRRRRGPISALCESPRLRRWAVAGLFAVPLLHLASFGPACWLAATPRVAGGNDAPRFWMRCYFPVGALIHHAQLQDSKPLRQWITLCARKGGRVIVPTDATGNNWYGFTAE